MFDNYNLTFSELKLWIGGNDERTLVFLNGLGRTVNSAINSGLVDINRIKENFVAMALAGQGKIPASRDTAPYLEAVTSAVENRPWSDRISFVSSEVSKDLSRVVSDIGETVQDTGASLLQTLKGLNVILPVLLIGAVVFVVFSRARKLG